ncbi:MAG: hypothetical protein QME12_02830 [Nanoarchaeota archaeon]|nr:hypothetical protein [Nanoarchaeota archaeon]
MALEFRDIVVKKSGWKEFVSPVHKKLTPVVLPGIAIGYVFFNIADFLIESGKMSGLQGKLFIVAVIFLYLWLLLQLFMLSCWVYTYLSTTGKSGPSGGERY